MMEKLLRQVTSLESSLGAAAGAALTQKLLGDVLLGQRKFEEALESYDQALAAGTLSGIDTESTKAACVDALGSLGREDVQAKYLSDA